MPPSANCSWLTSFARYSRARGERASAPPATMSYGVAKPKIARSPPLGTNMGKVPPGLRYWVGTANGGTDSKFEPITAPRINWDGTTDKTADEIVQEQSGPAAPKTAEAVAFLHGELAEGPKPVSHVKVHAEALCISPYALRSALEELGVKARAVKGHIPPKWEYALPGEPDFG